MNTVAGVCVEACVAPAGFNFPIRSIRQAQRPAATQKIANSVLDLLSLFAGTVLFNLL
jgi:hypothetical protein